MTDHPITPPPELVQKWAQYQGFESPEVLWHYIATQAARWGADQELEACCDYMRSNTSSEVHCVIDAIWAARRPKPPSLKEQALQALDEERADMAIQNYKLVRSVLESLPE